MATRRKERSGIITLTSDFGTAGSYVAAMKGVILSINPGACLVDVSHEISRHAVFEAAFVLSSCAFNFPRGTVHLAVVDPGVGSERKLLILEEKGHLFVGPDNGLFSLVISSGWRARWIRARPFFLCQVSPTFHGRDILAPVAAYLSLGRQPEEFGPPIKAVKRFRIPRPRRLAGPSRELAKGRKPTSELEGEVIYIDAFGNLVTNVTREHLAKLVGWPFQAKPRTGLQLAVALGDKKIYGIKVSYFQGAEKEVIALFGSHNFLEVAVRKGSAAQVLGAKVGQKVRLTMDKR